MTDIALRCRKCYDDIHQRHYDYSLEDLDALNQHNRNSEACLQCPVCGGITFEVVRR